jgi:hypothetical protein
MLTQAEAEMIKTAANMHNLSVSEYIRNAALGRKMDMHFETETVLRLIDVVDAIKAIHKGMVEKGITPPEEIMRQMIEESVKAIQRVSK